MGQIVYRVDDVCPPSWRGIDQGWGSGRIPTDQPSKVWYEGLKSMGTEAWFLVVYELQSPCDDRTQVNRDFQKVVDEAQR